MTTICHYTATSTDLPLISRAAVALNDARGPVKLWARNKLQLSDDARVDAFVAAALKADVIVLSLHGGTPSCPAFQPLVGALAERRATRQPVPYLHIQSSNGDDDAIMAAKDHSDGITGGSWAGLMALFNQGGSVNVLAALDHLLDRAAGADTLPPAPVPVRFEGISHPRLGDHAALEDLLPLLDPERPTVGVMFFQTYWLNDDRRHVDAMVTALEVRGLNVIPVYGYRMKDASLGNLGADDLFRAYFTRDGHTVIDALVNLMSMSLTLTAPHYAEVLPELDVPVLQGMTSLSPRAQWEASPQGMSAMDVAFQAAQPEFDGSLICVVEACQEAEEIDPVTGALLTRLVPLADRVDQLADMTVRWSRLRRADNADKKVAVVFHHHPPRDDRIGCASGLDSFESVRLLLERLRAEGYTVGDPFPDAQSLAEAMLDRLTCDRRWLTPEAMHARAEAHADAARYLPWHTELLEQNREDMTVAWGPMPGTLFVHNDELSFAGLVSGNIFITIQPPRGVLEKAEADLHSLIVPPTHHYLGHYRWIRDVFGADAAVHVGTHGSLEWLPGKALGLSRGCYPDIMLDDIPNLYPYIVNNPGEGTQAKRRSAACIVDHLTPPMRSAELHDDVASVERLLDELADVRRQDPSRLAVLYRQVWEAVVAADLHHDLELDEEAAMADPDTMCEDLHDYLTDLADTIISDGLHVLGGRMPVARLVRYLAQLTRLSQQDADGNEVPSLRETIVRAWGHSLDDLTVHRGETLPGYGGRTGGAIILQAADTAENLMGVLADADFDTAAIPDAVATHLPGAPRPLADDVATTLTWVATDLVDRLARVTEEQDALVRGLSGRFIRPGSSGAPTRGRADVLPTGRNFFSVDPTTLPTPSAWEVGCALASETLDKHLREEGRYPDNIGIIVYGTSTMRTHGEDIAEILYLLGCVPVRGQMGRVTGLRVIPAEELGRPRIDVTPRVSGFFRDAFPNLMYLIDDAVRMVAALDEPDETNFVRAHVTADAAAFTGDGMSQEDAWRQATLRVFGCPPGGYGAGVAELVEARSWETREDLAAAYVRYSSHAYTRETYGDQHPEAFRRQLGRMDVTIKNEDTREWDILSCTDYYNYYGGLIASATVERGGVAPMSLVGDTSDPTRVVVKTTQEESKKILRSRILNPLWIEGLMRHGYKGAGDLSKVMDILLGWDATADLMDDWMYQRIADRYALDPAMQEWFQQVNPYALQNITDKLLEAIQRGMWAAPQDTKEALESTYMGIEGTIEDTLDTEDAR